MMSNGIKDNNLLFGEVNEVNKVNEINEIFFEDKICECERNEYDYNTYDDNWFLRCLKCNKFLTKKLKCGHIKILTENKLCLPIEQCKKCNFPPNLLDVNKIKKFFESLLNEVHLSGYKEIIEVEYLGIRIKLLYGDQYISKLDSLICHSCYYPIKDIAHCRIKRRLCYKCVIDQLLSDS